MALALCGVAAAAQMAHADDELARGLAARAAGDLAAAQLAFAHAMLREPSALSPRLELAVTYAWAGELDRALLHYQAAMVLDPTSAAASNGASRVRLWRGELSAAAAGFRAQLARSPGDLEAMLGLAAVAIADDDRAAARGWYQRALAIAPGHAEAEAGLRALDAQLRDELAVTVTQAAGAAGPRGELALVHRARRHVEVRLRVASAEPQGDRFALDYSRGHVDLELGRRGRAMTASVGLEWLGGDAGATWGAHAELARGLGRWTVGGFVRVRRAPDRNYGLGAVMLTRRWLDAITTGARIYVAADGGAAAVATAGWSTGRWTLSAEVGLDDDRAVAGGARVERSLGRRWRAAVLGRLAERAGGSELGVTLAVGW